MGSYLFTKLSKDKSKDKKGSDGETAGMRQPVQLSFLSRSLLEDGQLHVQLYILDILCVCAT